MEKRYFISPLRMTARISDTVIDGEFININGYKYQRVSKAPVGRRKLRTLVKEDESLKFVIYN